MFASQETTASHPRELQHLPAKGINIPLSLPLVPDVRDTEGDAGP